MGVGGARVPPNSQHETRTTNTREDHQKTLSIRHSSAARTYRAGGWSELGAKDGCGRHARDFYVRLASPGGSSRTWNSTGAPPASTSCILSTIPPVRSCSNMGPITCSPSKATSQWRIKASNASCRSRLPPFSLNPQRAAEKQPIAQNTPAASCEVLPFVTQTLPPLREYAVKRGGIDS